jgi:hypothetical protein
MMRTTALDKSVHIPQIFLMKKNGGRPCTTEMS